MPRKYSQKDGLSPLELLRAGIDHLNASEALFKGSPSHYDSAGYLAQLGVELLLKSWLLFVAGEFEGVHQLASLHANLVSCRAANRLSPQDTETMRLLDGYSELRYPNLDQPIDVGTEQQAHNAKLIDTLWNQMPDALCEALQSVNPLEKGGRVLMKKKIE
jgi:HEPN domain-containing protein